jgi:hypothetical protein
MKCCLVGESAGDLGQGKLMHGLAFSPLMTLEPGTGRFPRPGDGILQAPRWLRSVTWSARRR